MSTRVQCLHMLFLSCGYTNILSLISNLYFKWAIPEKIQTWRVEDILFWKPPLESLNLSIHPQNKLSPMGILQNCVTPLGNWASFQQPWKFLIFVICTSSFFNTPEISMSSNTPPHSPSLDCSFSQKAKWEWLLCCW